MKPSEFLQYVAGGLLIGFILLLLVSQLLGQPAIVFVETGSMVPTLQPNDGYLAVPAVIADDPEVGDVILFESQNLGGGELTTHRVVEITDEGYITQGDANPFTDQDGDEPPSRRARSNPSR
ncbi:signal peptidase I [Halonotius sp. GCM10025705]|uniref:signal peptidase I n=1 Tax=Halonotius sp. GCM10025705 TaxID=3252678 RepID=UPI003616A05F